MTKTLPMLPVLWTICIAAPLSANAVIEPTFEEKMELSELVVIGTIATVDRGGRNGSNSTATLSVLTTLKGKAEKTIVVRTYHPVEELDPRCCQVGATYLMFLRRLVQDGQLVSVRGVYGMVRVGGPKSEYRVIDPK
jgi:hypothetical protein